MGDIETLREIRLKHIRFVLEHTCGDIEKASLILNIQPQDLRRIMRELGGFETSHEKSRKPTHREE